MVNKYVVVAATIISLNTNINRTYFSYFYRKKMAKQKTILFSELLAHRVNIGHKSVVNYLRIAKFWPKNYGMHTQT